MISLAEFKLRYTRIIEEYALTEEEVNIGYDLFKEDPLQFHENMLL